MPICPYVRTSVYPSVRLYLCLFERKLVSKVLRYLKKVTKSFVGRGQILLIKIHQSRIKNRLKKHFKAHTHKYFQILVLKIYEIEGLFYTAPLNQADRLVLLHF